MPSAASPGRGRGADVVFDAHDHYSGFAAALDDEAFVVFDGAVHDLAKRVLAMWASTRWSMGYSIISTTFNQSIDALITLR